MAMTSDDPVPQQVVELRRYALRAGQRDTLIDLFERLLIEPQEETGMAVLGQFTDLDDPDSFVWLRGFSDMDSRRKGLTAFYEGPVWRKHRDAANATMLDSDNVLLLEPASHDSGFSLQGHRRGHGAAASGSGRVVVGIHYLEPGARLAAQDTFERRAAPTLATIPGSLLAYFSTHPAENDYPALPVRDENVLVWLVGFTSPEFLEEAWSDIRSVHRIVSEKVAAKGQAELLRLAPTMSSLVTGGFESCGATLRLSQAAAGRSGRG